MIEIDDNTFKDLQEIHKRIKGRYLLSAVTGVQDSEGGYGWMHFVTVNVFEPACRCTKCGFVAGGRRDPSDIDGHRHIWERYDKNIFRWNGADTDEPLMKEFEKKVKLWE